MARTNAGRALLDRPAFRRLERQARDLTAMSYWHNKQGALADALAGALAESGIEPDELVRRVEAEGPGGPAAEFLIAAVTVGETSFFRYREQFAALAAMVIPERLKANRDRRSLTLWSAGCSLGAETYSLSILLRRSFAIPLLGWRLAILGTDVNAAALAQARLGEFSDWVVRDMDPALKRQSLARIGNKWRVQDVYREGVAFRRHNLAADPPPFGDGACDVILCRNVLMYFDAPTQCKVIATLHRSLAEGGWLVVGHAELGLDFGPGFEPMPADGCVLLRKRRPDRRAPARAVGAPSAAREKRQEAPPALGESLATGVRALLDRGRHDEALPRCRTWVGDWPLEAEAHYHLGLALEPNHPAQAEEAFRRALSLAPQMVMAHLHLLRLLVARDGAAADRQRRALMRLLASRPDDEPVALGGGMSVADVVMLATRLRGDAR